MMRRLFLALAMIGSLGGCAADSVWATDEEVARVSYRDSGPASLTLFTMVSNDSGKGAHSSLMINASQRVIFDPSGTFAHETIPERNDVIFGVTPYIADVYTRYHARKTYHVIVQTIEVSPQVAELALQKALSNGAVMNAYCANATSSLLGTLPGFGNISTTFFPLKLSEQFGTLPGVKMQKLYEYDDDDKSKVLRAYVPDKTAG